MGGNNPPGGWDQDDRPARPLRTIAVLIAVLVIAGGGTATAVILTSDPEDEPARDARVTLADWCDDMDAVSEQDEVFAADPARAAEVLEEVGVPPRIPPEAVRGRELIIEIAEKAEDSEEVGALYLELSEKDAGDVEAFFTFWSTSCASEEAPAE